MLSLIGGFIEFLIIKSCFFCKWIFDKIDQIESNQTATVSPLHRDFGAGIGRAVFKSGINRRCAVMMLPVPEYQSRLCGIMCTFDDALPYFPGVDLFIIFWIRFIIRTP